MKAALTGAGIPESTILGVRAPELKPGGVDGFTALNDETLN